MLDRKKWKEADALFEQALDLPTEDRDAFLDSQCSDPDIRDHVRRLLDDDDDTVAILDTGGGLNVLDSLKTAPKPDMPPHHQLPGFRILELLGEGGMGQVWAAEQLQPVQRPVAIKLIRQGYGSREVIRRFEAERQALALMNHPNIAKVYDGGISLDGRPYFVMERVDGVPITQYCDQHRLTTSERLALMVDVCAAIQHAHRQGIIHRDIKPMNVLVTTVDQKPVPKVIDFGIARATRQRLTEETVFTRLGQMIGTPEYMSPEQADGDIPNIDTRTDVYSLGVLLYELLVGVQPFDPVELRRLGFEAMRKRICETDPPRPSTRLAETDDKTTEVLKSQRTEAAILRRRLRSDLDWVVMKALEKERDRRYESPSELAADLQRHLADEPVLASPPSLVYRLRKLTRKHRIYVTAAVLVFLATALGAAVSTWQAFRAVRAEQAALREAETARRVSDFLVDLFQEVDPTQARGNDPRVSEVLDRGSQKIHDQLSEEPLVRARLMATIGEIYRRLGKYDRARPLFESAHSIRESTSGVDPMEQVQSMLAIAKLHVDLSDDASAAPLLREVHARTVALTGSESAETAERLNDLGELARRQSRLDEAADFHRQALAIEKNLFGSDSLKVATTLGNLGAVLIRLEDFEQAAEVLRRSTAIEAEFFAPYHPKPAIRLDALAIALSRLGKSDEALEIQHRVLEIYERALGGTHRKTAIARLNLGSSYGRLGRLDEALDQFYRVAEIREEIFGAEHMETARIYLSITQALRLKGDLQAAEDYARRALSIGEAQEHDDSFWRAACHSTLSRVLHALARYDESVAHTLEAQTLFQETVGTRHPEYRRTLDYLGQTLTELNRLEEAAAYFQQSLGFQKDDSGTVKRTAAFALDGLGRVRRLQGHAEQAAELHRRALKISKTKGTDHPSQPRSLIGLGHALLMTSDLDSAEPCFREAQRIAELNHGDRHLDGASALFGLGLVKREQHEADAARAYLEESRDIRAARLGAKHPRVLEVTEALKSLP